MTQPQLSPPVEVDSWRTKFSNCQQDHNYSNTAVGHSPVCTLSDEINLEPVTSAWKGVPTQGKGKNPLAPRPAIVKKKNKKVQLNRRQSLADLSSAGQGYDYGLPEDDYSQPEESELKITSVKGEYSSLYSGENHSEEAKYKKEEESAMVSAGDNAREKLFKEIESTDPDNISSNISSLSLGMNPDELPVLHEIYENVFTDGQGNNLRPSLHSIQSMCDHLKIGMQYPSCHTIPKDRA